MNTFFLRIATPDGDCFTGDAIMLTVRGVEGELAVMAGHIPFVTSVKPCKIKIETDNDEFYATVGGGILSVSNNETVLMSSSYQKE